MTKSKVGVLVMSYGTPESLDQVEAYYTHIRRGNPPSAEQLKALTDRYEAIVGGFFPLRKNTDRQVAGLQDRLNQLNDGTEYICYQGLKHARPYIEDGVQAMVKDGIDQAVGIVLAPHYSIMSVGGYIKRAKDTAEALGLTMDFVQSYHDHPVLIETLSERVNEGLSRFAPIHKDEIMVLFSAHSLPEKILEINDPYQEQLLETSRLIAKSTGVSNWRFAWQSAGQTAVPWLGPDILKVVEELHEQGVKQVLISPIGFVSDHLEVLYDIDIEAKQLASKLDMRLERTESLNVDPRYMHVLADKVQKKFQEMGGSV
jgi:ferrochelatase